MANKQELVDFLEKRVFRPVLDAKPEDYPESKRDDLLDVQRSTRSEVQRFRNYESAEQVKDMYRDDLSSKAAKDVQRKSRELGLPTLPEVRDEFEKLANNGRN